MELAPPVVPPVPAGPAPPVGVDGRMLCPPVAGDSSRLPTTSSFEQPRIVPQHSQTTVPSLMLTSLVGGSSEHQKNGSLARSETHLETRGRRDPRRATDSLAAGVGFEFVFVSHERHAGFEH